MSRSRFDEPGQIGEAPPKPKHPWWKVTRSETTHGDVKGYHVGPRWLRVHVDVDQWGCGVDIEVRIRPNFGRWRPR